MGLRFIRSLKPIVLYLVLATPGHRCSAASAGTDPSFDANPAFAVVSIKLSSDSEADEWGMGIRGRHFWATHVTTNELIGYAYGLNAHQIEHAPDWFSTERFDVEGIPDTEAQPTREQYRTMLQLALVERFGMKFHSSRKMLPVYILSVATGGVKIPTTTDAVAKPSWGVHRGWLQIKNMTFGSVAAVMQRTIFDRPVLDQTGLSGLYSYTLRWRADETQFAPMQGVDVPEEAGTGDNEDIYTAARQQLGIKIEAKKALAPTMIIDAVSHPTAN